MFFLKNSKHFQITALTTDEVISIMNILPLVQLIFVRMEVVSLQIRYSILAVKSQEL